MIKLYNEQMSGNCYKLRLFMALLGIAYERCLLYTSPSPRD